MPLPNILEFPYQNGKNVIVEIRDSKAYINAAKIRNTKAVLQLKYSQLDRAVKRSAWKDKRAFANELAIEAQIAAETQRNGKGATVRAMGELLL